MLMLCLTEYTGKLQPFFFILVKNHNRPGQTFNYDVSETSTDVRRVEMVIEILWNINLTSFSLAVSSETNGTLGKYHVSE